MKCTCCLKNKAEYIEEGNSKCLSCLEKERKELNSFFKKLLGSKK